MMIKWNINVIGENLILCCENIEVFDFLICDFFREEMKLENGKFIEFGLEDFLDYEFM